MERKHRHIIETTIALLSKVSLPFQYWFYAAQIAVFFINLLTTATLHSHSPYYLLYHSQPDLNQLRIFGCAYYPLLRPYTSYKLEPRTKECIFLGYSSVSKGYLCFDPITNNMYTSRHVFLMSQNSLFLDSLLLHNHLLLLHLTPFGYPIYFTCTLSINLLF